MKQSMEDVKLAVKRGVELLDEQAPGWEQRVDLNRFDISQVDNCICGQLGVWGQLTLPNGRSIIATMQEYGFAGNNYPLLDKVWRELIGERLG